MKKGQRSSDLLGTLLLLSWVAAALAVATYDPHDPIRPLAAPVHAQPHNLLNWPGAWLSAQLYHLLGWSLIPTLAFWFLAGCTLLFGKRTGLWWRRLLGSQLLIPATASLALLAHWPLSAHWQPTTGSGGLLGDALYQQLRKLMEPAYLYVATIAFFVVGIILTLDFTWPWLFKCWNILHDWWKARQLPEPIVLSTGPIKASVLAGKEQLPDTIPIRHPDQFRKNKTKTSPALKIAATEDEDDEFDVQEFEVDDTVDQPIPVTLSLKDLPSLKKNAIPIQGEVKTLSEHATDEVWKQEGDYQMPPLTVLEEPEPPPYHQPEHEQRLRDRAAKLEQIFADFGINVRVVGINTGPVITQFEIALETGLRLSRVTSLADDLALRRAHV